MKRIYIIAASKEAYRFSSEMLLNQGLEIEKNITFANVVFEAIDAKESKDYADILSIISTKNEKAGFAETTHWQFEEMGRMIEYIHKY